MCISDNGRRNAITHQTLYVRLSAFWEENTPKTSPQPTPPLSVRIGRNFVFRQIHTGTCDLNDIGVTSGHEESRGVTRFLEEFGGF